MHEAERARNNSPAPGRAPRLAFIALAGAWLLSIAGAAGTQLDALTYLDPAVADAREDFALRQRALAGLPGLHASVTALSLAYGTLATGETALVNDATSGTTPAWSAGLFVDATVGYSYDRVSLLNDRAALLQTGADVVTAIRRGVFQALDMHARLLQLQLAQDQDAMQVKAAQADAARVGTASAKYLLAALRLQQVEDHARLADLRRRAAGYGLEPEAEYASLRFVLPETALERTVAYRLAVLDRDRARAQRDQDLVYGIVRGLALTATKVSGGLGMTARAGVMAARPGAELAVTYPAGTDGWSVGVNAPLVISSHWGQLAQDEHQARRADGRLEALIRDYPAHATRLRAEAGFAEQELALAEARAAFVDGTLAERAPAQGALAATAANARATLVQIWGRYIRSVYAYLDYVEAPWQVRGERAP